MCRCKKINSVLNECNLSRFNDSHRLSAYKLMNLSIMCRVWTTQTRLRYLRYRMWYWHIVFISDLYKRSSFGPRTEPWETPQDHVGPHGPTWSFTDSLRWSSCKIEPDITLLVLSQQTQINQCTYLTMNCECLYQLTQTDLGLSGSGPWSNRRRYRDCKYGLIHNFFPRIARVENEKKFWL